MLGVLLGGLSGYFGGATDTVIQRGIEFIMSIPTLPLWLGLAAAVPPGWGPLKTYFAITMILSLIGWTGTRPRGPRQVPRCGPRTSYWPPSSTAPDAHRVIVRHMLPGMTSHIIASLTLSMPGDDPGRDRVVVPRSRPAAAGRVSWGVLLQEAQNIRVLSTAPWLLAPGAAVVITVIA